MTRAFKSSFDELADSYDRYRIGYANELYETLAECGIRAGTRILDVACGTGLVTEALVERSCTVTGVDVSAPMLERARGHVPQATFVLGRAEDLPFLDDAFDGATSAQAFHWVDQERALAEITRVVRPGGSVAIWWKGLMRGDATRLVREEVARDLGLPSVPDLLGCDFDAFEDSALVEQRLRVIPWIVHMRVGDYLGYEHSRARSRDAYGAKLETYFALLKDRLGSPEAELSLSYLHLLYLGRVPANA